MNGLIPYVTDGLTSNPEADSDGFPNGPRFGDDVLDIALAAAIGDLRGFPATGISSDEFEFNTPPGKSNADSDQVDDGVVFSPDDNLAYSLYQSSGSDGQAAAIVDSQAMEEAFVSHGVSSELELLL